MKSRFSPAFALPTILISSGVMLIVLLLAIQSTISVSEGIRGQYADKLGSEAAESGVALAKACIAQNGTITWTNTKPLKPNTDCTGTELFSCPLTSSNPACYLLDEGLYQSSFTVGVIYDAGNNPTDINAQGIVREVRKTNGAVIKQTSTSQLQNLAGIALAQPVNYSDDFASSGALGNVKTGTPVIPWLFLNSASTNWTRNTDSSARVNLNSNVNPMAILAVQAPDVEISLTPSSTSGTIYYRVVDATNWLRTRVNYVGTTTYSTQPGHTCNFQWADGSIHTYGNNFFAPTPQQAEITYGAMTGSCYRDGSYGQYAEGTTYYYYLVVDKSVAGTITSLSSVNIGSGVPTFIKVVTKGANVKSYYGSSLGAMTLTSNLTESTHQTATQHGIGYSQTTNGGKSGGIKSFVIKDAP